MISTQAHIHKGLSPWTLESYDEKNKKEHDTEEKESEGDCEDLPHF